MSDKQPENPARKDAMFLYYREYEHSGEEPEVIYMSHVPATVAGNISAAQDDAIRRPGRRATIGVDLHPRHGRTRYSVEYHPGPARRVGRLEES